MTLLTSLRVDEYCGGRDNPAGGTPVPLSFSGMCASKLSPGRRRLHTGGAARTPQTQYMFGQIADLTRNIRQPARLLRLRKTAFVSPGKIALIPALIRRAGRARERCAEILWSPASFACARGLARWHGGLQVRTGVRAWLFRKCPAMRTFAHAQILGCIL